MKAKEKAIDLFNKFLKTDEKCTYSFVGDKVAKQCALIAVDEIIENEKIDNLEDNNLSYWEEVKQEIEKL